MTERYTHFDPEYMGGAGYRVRTDDIQLGKTKTAVSGCDGQ